jgi:small GTP-binding protein
MPTLDDFTQNLPAETQDVVKNIWGKIPESDRRNLISYLEKIPLDSRLVTLANLVQKEMKFAFGKKRNVVIVGPANVGKSTLYNQFVRSKTDRAEVGPLPGTTRTSQLADSPLFTIVDTPGADAVGEVGDNEKQIALDTAIQADFIVIVFDAIQGIKRSEQDLFKELTALNKPYIVVLNKIDLVRREAAAVTQLAAKNLGLKTEQIIGIVARDGKNTERIIMAVASAEPEIVAALGAAMPQYRWKLAWQAMVSAATAAALIGLLPIPFLDFIPLVITQSVMVIAIARIYNHRITLVRARELVVTFGLGYLGRALFYELSKLGGIPGWLLGSAIASSMTIAMGYAAAIWFEKGERPTRETLQAITRAMTGYLLQSLKSFARHKPDKETLRQHIYEALKSSPISENPILLEKQAEEFKKN